MHRAVNLPPWLAEALTRTGMGNEKRENVSARSMASTVSAQSPPLEHNISSVDVLDSQGPKKGAALQLPGCHDACRVCC